MADTTDNDDLAPIDPNDAPSGYSPDRAQRALDALRSRIAGSSPRAGRTVRFADAAIAAGRLLQIATSTEVAARLARLPPEEFSPSAVSDLEVLSWAAWHLDIQASRPTARSAARVPADLSEAAMEQRKDLLNLLEFGLRGDAQIQAELAAIRSGGGYVDLLRDLIRLGELVQKHSALLAVRLPHDYTPGLTDEAFRLADELRQALGLVPDNVQDDTPARFWGLFSAVFYDVKGAIGFLYRNDSARLAGLPSLSAARKAVRRSSGATPRSAAPES